MALIFNKIKFEFKVNTLKLEYLVALCFPIIYIF